MTARQRWSLGAAVLGSSIVFLDSTIVTVALKQIGEDLRSTSLGVLEAQSYIYNGYLLALSSLLIVAGAATDRYGRRRMCSLGLVGFGIASLLCGVAASMEMLVGFRLLQGAAGALLVPGSLAIITASFPEAEQGRAFGIWAGASAGTIVLGPFLGGVLVDVLTWRAGFFMNLPIIAVAVWATLAHVPESRDEEATGVLDWIGAGIVALLVGGLGFGAIRGQESQWQDASAFIGLGLGVAALAVLPVWLARSAHPLIPPDMFRSRNFTVINAATFLIYGALYVMFLFTAIFLQGALGYNAAATGIATVPSLVFIALFSPRFGKLAAEHGSRWFMAGGAAIMAVGVLWLSRIPANSDAWLVKLDVASTLIPPSGYVVDVLPAMIVFGLGAMMMVAPLTTALMASVPPHRAGVASAVNNAISRIGPQLAGAAIFVVVSGIYFGSLGDLAPELDTSAPEIREQFSALNAPGPGANSAQIDAAREASTDAFSFAMLTAAALLVLGGGVSMAVERQGAAEGDDRATRAVAGPTPSCGPLEIDYPVKTP